MILGIGGPKKCGRLRFRRDRALIQQRTQALLEGIDARLKTIRPYVPGIGQKPKRDNADLAAFLGVRYVAADLPIDTLRRYVEKMQRTLLQTLWGHSGKRWYKVQQIVDSNWIPRWPNRKQGIGPNHPFRKYLVTSEQLRARFLAKKLAESNQ